MSIVSYPQGETDVVVAVVIPVVVDIEAVLVEVADIDTVAVRSDIVCPFSSMALEIEVYCQEGLYPFFPLFYSGAIFCQDTSAKNE